MQNQEPTRYCNVSWNIKDVKELRPEWSDEEAENFLATNEDKMLDLMIQRGWEILESFID
jgi:hypothetical protein